MGLCCASSCSAWGELAACPPACAASGLFGGVAVCCPGGSAPEFVTCAERNIGTPAAIRPRRVVVRNTSNMAASIRCASGPSIDRKVEHGARTAPDFRGEGKRTGPLAGSPWPGTRKTYLILSRPLNRLSNAAALLPGQGCVAAPAVHPQAATRLPIRTGCRTAQSESADGPPAARCAGSPRACVPQSAAPPPCPPVPPSPRC